MMLRKQRPTQLKLLPDMKGNWTCVICLALIFICSLAAHVICPLSAYEEQYFQCVKYIIVELDLYQG